MKIAVLHYEHDFYAAQIVESALVRSFSASQVQRCTYSGVGQAPLAAVLIQPGSEHSWILGDLLRRGGKALVLGRAELATAELLGLAIDPGLLPSAEDATAVLDSSQPFNESLAVIRYDVAHPLAAASPLARRALCRFDFLDEWNNLGYGRIPLDRTPWAIATGAQAAGAEAIATIRAGSRPCSLYASLRRTEAGAALWFNRAVGPVDSLEWRVVEAFFSSYGTSELICLPSLVEVPAGYECAVTMRLDCDEAIASARPLLDLYSDLSLPLSLAILTGLSWGADDGRLVDDALARGGSLLAHSVHHWPNWGGTYDRALCEARESKRWLEEHAPSAAPVRFAVSPFHQNPSYAVRGLKDAAYDGFVSGIISSDPEYLLGRAGRVPLVDPPMVSLSAQSMLHGDCYRRAAGSMDVYQESFENHRAAQSIFAYLDHPFSDRYQYGWDDEAQRLEAHARLLSALRSQEAVWWPSLAEAMDFLCLRDQASVRLENGVPAIDHPCAEVRRRLAVQWKGRTLNG